MSVFTGKVEVNGVVTSGTLRLRKTMSASAQILAEIPDGTTLSVETTSNNSWFKTSYNNKTGYVTAQYIAVTSSDNLIYRVNTTDGVLNVRNTPSSSGMIIYTAPKNRGLYKLGESGSWYRVSCALGTGWASKSFLVNDASATPTNFVTVQEYLEHLESFCGCGWSYASGYNATQKTVDCAYYPFKARNSLGEHGATSEYDSIQNISSEKGHITSFDNLVAGMEVFQSNSSNSNIKDHMDVYAGRISINGVLCHAVYQSRSSYNSSEVAKYSEHTGPILTEMSSSWDYWGWSPYVIH